MRSLQFGGGGVQTRPNGTQRPPPYWTQRWVAGYGLILPMESDIRDIKGLMPVPLEGWVWLLLAFVVVAGGLIVWVIWRHRRAGVVNKPGAPSLSPAEVALNALQQLRQEALPVEVFYTRLSNIVRYFIEDQFGLRAPERTTEEFLAEATLPAQSLELLRAFLQEADLVKFARHRPGQEDRERAFAAAESFIRGGGVPVASGAVDVATEMSLSPKG